MANGSTPPLKWPWGARARYLSWMRRTRPTFASSTSFTFLLAALASSALAASCKTEKLPAQLDDPKGHPVIIGGGGGDSGASDGALSDVDAAVVGGCADAPASFGTFAPSRVIYVAPDGTDTNDGATRATAWRSLAKAGAELQPGDRVDIFTGSYTCGVDIGVHATASRPVWIRSVDGPLKAVFNCGGAGIGFHLVSAKYVAIDGFDINTTQLDGIEIDSGIGPSFPDLSDHITIMNNHVHGTGAAGIHVTQATNIDVFANEIDTTEGFGPNAGGQGIDLVAVSGARIVGNNVHDIATNTAIQVRGGALNTRIAANRITSSLEGIHLGGTSDRPFFLPPDSDVEGTGVIAHSNLLTGSVGVAFSAIGCKSCLIANNTVAITGSTQTVRLLPGNTGATASGSISHTINLRLINNVFALSGAAPTKLLNIVSTEEVGFTQSNNIFFFAAGSVGTIPTDVAIGGTGTFTDKDPLFVNATAGDYTLQTASVGRMAAKALTEVLYTATGACRTTWNIGAY